MLHIQRHRKFYSSSWCKELLRYSDSLCFNGIRDLTDIVVSYCDIPLPAIHVPFESAFPALLIAKNANEYKRFNKLISQFKHHVYEIYSIGYDEIICRMKDGITYVLFERDYAGTSRHIAICHMNQYLSEINSGDLKRAFICDEDYANTLWMRRMYNICVPFLKEYGLYEYKLNDSFYVECKDDIVIYNNEFSTEFRKNMTIAMIMYKMFEELDDPYKRYYSHKIRKWLYGPQRLYLESF